MTNRCCVAMSLLSILALSSATVALAQPAEKTNDLKELRERLQNVETELLRLKAEKGENVPAGVEGVRTVVETPHVGATSYSTPMGVKNTRYVAMKLVFVNLSAKESVLEPRKITLTADGASYEYQEPPAQLRYIQIGNQSQRTNTLQPPAKLTLAPGGTGTSWVVFYNLPSGNTMPKMALRVPVGDKTNVVDLNDSARRQLGLSVDRIGPKGALGLVTIAGQFNHVNTGVFAETLDDLVSQKVVRVVIRFADGAPAVDSGVWNWLQQSVAMAGRGTPQNNANAQFPIFPARLQEVHISNAPKGNGSSRSSYYTPYGSVNSQGRNHATDQEAVSAALASAYQVLPREQLIADIRDGHPLTRAAAIAGGGGRLTAEQLPLLLEYANGDDVATRRAAIGALRHFGEPEALEALHAMVRKNVEPAAALAVASLAASRFAEAHDILLNILENEPPKSKIAIVGVLARHPRPVWADTMLEMVEDSDESVAKAALTALVQVGHPKLLDVLKSKLESGTRPMRDQAYSVLAGRTDPDSEEMALEYTLKLLEKNPPNSTMLNLIARTKDSRALPMLLQHFGSSGSMRQQLVTTLAQVGDEKVATLFAEKYPELNNTERRYVIRALQQMNSPQFHELAREAVLGNDSSLVSQTCDALRLDAQTKSVEILAEALEKSGSTSTWSYVTNALQQLATPAATTALVAARQSKNQQKSNYARNALNNLYQRSPANQYLYQARSNLKQGKVDLAIQQFDLAVKVDPALPTAVAERGNAHLRNQDAKKARADFQKALELDAWNSHAATGLAIVMCIEGDYTEGIRMAEANRSKHPNDNVFAYNVACVYGRALEKVIADEDLKDRDKLMDEYRVKALTELERARKLGFSDVQWMQKDPDLAPLREEDRFIRIHSPNRRPPRANPPAEDEAAEEAAEEAEAVLEQAVPFSLPE